MASPRNKILQYDQKDLIKAIDDVYDGMSVKAAAKKYKIPRTTLLYKIKGKYPIGKKIGHPTRFTSEQEEILKSWVINLAKNHFPITKENFKLCVSRLARELGVKFSENSSDHNKNIYLPGKKWFYGFLKRHPQISVRASQNLTSTRNAVTKEKLFDWFKEVHSHLAEINMLELLEKPERLFNVDESAFFLNPKANHVLALRGERTVYINASTNEKECMTVLVGGNAAGYLCPPMLIHTYERIPHSFSDSVPDHWGLGCSENGWSTCDVFFSYIANVFIPYINEKGIGFPVILFVDGHVSHLSYHLSNLCLENQIILVCLYPNSTHIIQPMDVSVFRTLKDGWREHVNRWKIENSIVGVTKKDFAPILNSVLEERVKPHILANGFKKCGLYPWNPNSIKYFFEKKTLNDTSLNMSLKKSSPSTFGLRECLSIFESYTGKDKLQAFRNTKEWSGQEVDKSLFHVWSKMTSDALGNVPFQEIFHNTQTSNTNPLQIICDENELQNSVCSHPHSSNMSISENNPENQLNEPQPEATFQQNESNVIILEKSVDIMDRESIPSPFKRSLFYPEENKSAKKKKKEKIPSVVTSKAWREYTEKKREEKEKQKNEKEKRKLARLAKKQQKTEEACEKKKKINKMVKIRRKRCKIETDSEDDQLTEDELHYCESDEDELDAFLDLDENQNFNKDDFVIVKYDDNYFPGQIRELKEGDVKEYYISTMQRSGPKGWKWSEENEDVTWYLEENVMQRIKPPSITNSRGVCRVPEVEQCYNK